MRNQLMIIAPDRDFSKTFGSTDHYFSLCQNNLFRIKTVSTSMMLDEDTGESKIIPVMTLFYYATTPVILIDHHFCKLN